MSHHFILQMWNILCRQELSVKVIFDIYWLKSTLQRKADICLLYRKGFCVFLLEKFPLIRQPKVIDTHHTGLQPESVEYPRTIMDNITEPAMFSLAIQFLILVSVFNCYKKYIKNIFDCQSNQTLTRISCHISIILVFLTLISLYSWLVFLI